MKVFEKFLIGNTDKQRVSIRSGSTQLVGHLVIPQQTQGLVLVTHGSGSNRSMLGNQCVAEYLREEKFATLLINLLTPEEEDTDLRNRHFRSDIGLLAERLVDVTDWLTRHSSAQFFNLGYLSSSCELGAALVAAIARPTVVKAIASLGGCPDLVTSVISQVKAPTLLMVGEYDLPGITMNEDALAQLQVDKRLVVIPNASHGFEESGVLETAGQFAISWFQQHLSGSQANTNWTPVGMTNF